MNRIPAPLAVASSLVIVTILATGCSDDARVARVAAEAADRQAAQNREMARVAQQAAEGAKQLAAADAEARRDHVRLQGQLQQERSELSGGWNDLEDERQRVAAQRHTTATAVVAVRGTAVVVVAVLALAVAWLALFARDDTDAEACELLVDQVLPAPTVDAGSEPNRLTNEATELLSSNPDDSLLTFQEDDS